VALCIGPKICIHFGRILTWYLGNCNEAQTPKKTAMTLVAYKILDTTKNLENE
jgi:hypothetical protein